MILRSTECSGQASPQKSAVVRRSIHIEQRSRERYGAASKSAQCVSKCIRRGPSDLVEGPKCAGARTETNEPVATVFRRTEHGSAPAKQHKGLRDIRGLNERNVGAHHDAVPTVSIENGPHTMAKAAANLGDSIVCDPSPACEPMCHRRGRRHSEHGSPSPVAAHLAQQTLGQRTVKGQGCHGSDFSTETGLDAAAHWRLDHDRQHARLAHYEAPLSAFSHKSSRAGPAECRRNKA